MSEHHWVVKGHTMDAGTIEQAAVERAYRMLTASLESPEFHRFVSNQVDTGSDGPQAA